MAWEAVNLAKVVCSLFSGPATFETQISGGATHQVAESEQRSQSVCVCPCGLMALILLVRAQKHIDPHLARDGFSSEREKKRKGGISAGG
jgi:hypothetical protein